MSEKQINALFHHNINEQFNPIQTFGNREGSHRRESNNKMKLKIKNNLYGLNEKEDDKIQGQAHRETRIKLLSSYQQSYLQSASQPMFTQQDQPQYDSKINNKYHNLSYSESKGSSYKGQNHIYTDPGEGYYERESKQLKGNKITSIITQQRHQADSQQPIRQTQAKSMLREAETRGSKKIQNSKDKIIDLQKAINEELYNLSIQQRLYDYLITRIDERGKYRSVQDDHLIVEKAIDFMDSGEQFMKQLVKLKKIQQN